MNGPLDEHRLSPEHEALFDAIAASWRARAFRPEPIDVTQATEAIHAVYDLLRVPFPNRVLSYPSPFAAWAAGADWLPYVGSPAVAYWEPQLIEVVHRGELLDANGRPVSGTRQRTVARHLRYAFQHDLVSDLLDFVPDWLGDRLEDWVLRDEPHAVDEGGFVMLGPTRGVVQETVRFEFYDRTDVQHDRSHRRAVTGLAQECGLVHPFRDVVILCDRPARAEVDGAFGYFEFSDGTSARIPRPRD
jgi:hypothetical protein